MIKLIVGTKGSGKTKTLVEMINTATKTTAGNVVVIEKGMQLTYNIDHKARLVDLSDYAIKGYPMLYGFVAGVLAGNYDTTELLIDGMIRVGGEDLNELGETLAKINKIAQDVEVVVTISAKEEELPESVKMYL